MASMNAWAVPSEPSCACATSPMIKHPRSANRDEKESDDICALPPIVLHELFKPVGLLSHDEGILVCFQKMLACIAAQTLAEYVVLENQSQFLSQCLGIVRRNEAAIHSIANDPKA